MFSRRAVTRASTSLDRHVSSDGSDVVCCAPHACNFQYGAFEVPNSKFKQIAPGVWHHVLALQDVSVRLKGFGCRLVATVMCPLCNRSAFLRAGSSRALRAVSRAVTGILIPQRQLPWHIRAQPFFTTVFNKTDVPRIDNQAHSLIRAPSRLPPHLRADAGG